MQTMTAKETIRALYVHVDLNVSLFDKFHDKTIRLLALVFYER